MTTTAPDEARGVPSGAEAVWDRPEVLTGVLRLVAGHTGRRAREAVMARYGSSTSWTTGTDS
ncbi:hypothetical protein [Streptomyces sp. NPDC019224]|uniref:hypothetical protein n=1 Tax=Streptomyces sp. NPDC019224 TaxID=3154484 RepID=UPI0033E06421